MKGCKSLWVIFLSVFIFAWAVNMKLYAQESEANSVKMLVRQQIAEAKKKNMAPVAVENEIKTVEKPVRKIKAELKSSPWFLNEYFIKGMIMLIAVAGVFGWLKIREARRQKQKLNNLFKKNIKLMREEKFIKEIDPKLKQIRTRLTLTSVVLNEEKKVTAAAKKSQIGKEEIRLASRIRSHELQYNDQRSLA
jgi:hypothetical protein